MGSEMCIRDSPGAPSTSAPSYTKLSDVLDPLSLEDDFSRMSRLGVGFTNIVTRGFGQSVHARITPDSFDDAIVTPDGQLYLSVTNSTAVLDVLRNGLKGRSSSSGSRPGSTPPSRSSSPRSAAIAAALAARSRSRSTSSSAPGSLTALWTAVRDGKSSLIVNTNNAAAITYVLQIVKDYPKADVVLIGSGSDIYLTLDQLKDSKVSVLIRAGLDVAPRSNRRINIPKMLHDADIDFGFSTSLDNSLTLMPDTPLFPVSLLVKTGLPKNKAVKALTQTPAEMLGLEKTLGSIEKGKQANLLILDGDPADATTSVKQLIVEGKSIYENQ